MATRGRGWFFTLNNPKNSEKHYLAKAKKMDLVYLIFQLEKGEEGETIHYQGFIYSEHMVSMKKLKKEFAKKAHWEIARSIPASIKYCSKKETRIKGPWEYGNPPGQGKRTDIKDLIESCQGGASDAELLKHHPEAFAKYTRLADRIRLQVACKKSMREKPECFYIWGPPGTGKTLGVHKREPQLYSWNGKWWDGYLPEYHTAVLYDDINHRLEGEHLSTVLRIMDGYSVMGEIKGGHINLEFKRFYITSVYPIEKIIKGDNTAGFTRRLKEIVNTGAIEDSDDVEELFG